MKRTVNIKAMISYNTYDTHVIMSTKHILPFVLFCLTFGLSLVSCSRDDDDESSSEQPDSPARYISPVFSSVTTTSVNFIDGDNLSMDIYRPQGDENRSRPVILYAHAGSFFDGSKASQEAQRFCEDFAKRGYVTVNIEYRLGSGIQILNDSIEMMSVIVRGVHDMKAALRFMRRSFENNNTYGIDTSRIIVAGSGAGATIALHTAFMNNQQVIPLHIAQILLAEGGLHGLRGNQNYSNRSHACVNLAGGLNNLSFMEANGPVLFSAQGSQDDNFPFLCGKVFESFPPTTDRLRLCGARALEMQAESLQIPNGILRFQGESHRPWVDGSSRPNARFDDVVDSVSVFLFDNLINN